MNIDEYKPILILVTVLSIIVAYFTSVRAARKKYGTQYMSIVSAYQWKCLKGLAPIGLYLIVTIASGDFSKLLNGVAFSIAAASFFAMSAHELSMGFALNHEFQTISDRVALLSRVNIIGLILSVVTVVLVFQSQSVNFFAVAWQASILFVSLLAFYVNGSMVNLVKAGYVPQQNT